MSSNFINNNISNEEEDEAVESSTAKVTCAKKFNLTQDAFKALIDLI